MPDDLTATLDRIRAELRTFGANSADTALLLAAVDKVLELHQPVDRGTGAKCKGCATHVTFTRWPCPTYQAITSALTGTQQGEDRRHGQ